MGERKTAYRPNRKLQAELAEWRQAALPMLRLAIRALPAAQRVATFQALTAALQASGSSSEISAALQAVHDAAAGLDPVRESQLRSERMRETASLYFPRKRRADRG